MDTADIRERIRTLYPGDENKSLRNRLYSKPDFLKALPSDDEIRAEAGWEPAGQAHKEESESIEGEILAAEEQAQKAKTEALVLAGAAKAMIVNTAEDYLEADKVFSKIKAMLKANEDLRVKLKAPILEAGRRLDETFKEAAVPLNAALALVESPMKSFKAREREDLRKQEEERQRLINEEKARAQKEADEARARLEAARKQVEEADDSFLAALLQEDADQAVEDTRNALVAVAMAPQRVLLPDAAVPVTAAGSRASFPWVYEIVDEALVDRSLCSPDPKKINALVKALKENLNGDITKLTPKPGLIIKEDVRIGGR